MVRKDQNGPGERVPLSMSALLSLLASATRLEVMATLAERSLTARELAEQTNLSVPLAFHHLLALYQHGLVDVARQHDEHRYRLSGCILVGRTGPRVRLQMTVRNGDALSLTLGQ